MTGLIAKTALVINTNYLAFYRRIFDVWCIFANVTEMKVGDLQNTGRMFQLKNHLSNCDLCWSINFILLQI